jgi:hypothetical protein
MDLPRLMMELHLMCLMRISAIVIIKIHGVVSERLWINFGRLLLHGWMINARWSSTFMVDCRYNPG